MADVKIRDAAATSVDPTDEFEVDTGADTFQKATPPKIVAGSVSSNGIIERTGADTVTPHATLPTTKGGTGVAIASGGILQAFVFRITNTAGTLQHAFYGDGSLGAGNLHAKINGATNTLTNTPTGDDASTAMANGGKISSANTSDFYLDVTAQTAADSVMVCVVGASSAAAINVLAARVSIDINGVTHVRQRLRFFNATGGAFNLTTANIGAGTSIFVQCLGVLA